MQNIASGRALGKYALNEKVTKKAIEEKIYLLEAIGPFSFNNTGQWFRKVA